MAVMDLICNIDEIRLIFVFLDLSHCRTPIFLDLTNRRQYIIVPPSHDVTGNSLTGHFNSRFAHKISLTIKILSY